MAQNDSGGGTSRKSGTYPDTRPILTSRITSIADISTPDTDSIHDFQNIFTPSPPSKVAARSYSTDDRATTRSFSIDDKAPVRSLSADDKAPAPSYSGDDVDVSHVQLSPKGPTATPTSQGGSLQNCLAMLVPENFRIVSPPSESPRRFSPFTRNTNPSYSPISDSEASTFTSQPARTNSSKRYSTKRESILGNNKHDSIPEEAIGLTLLGSAMPMGVSDKPVGATVEEVEDDGQGKNVEPPEPSPMAAGFDISTFAGTIGSENGAQLQQEIYRQEALGILTGGLGQGEKPSATISSKELYAQEPTTPLSRRVTRKTLGRAPTLRSLGQSEANKRGEVIEVIVDSTPVDLSSFAGGNNANSSRDFTKDPPFRNGTINSKVEVFYPQANWKPITMRWPYLTALIVVSIVLAASQEFLCQKADTGHAALFTFRAPEDLKTWDYFTFKYLPTGVAVTFGVLWQLTDFEVKRLEAYYQLSKEGGALAAESLNVDYITFFNYLRPIKALQFRHYAVAISSIATLIAVSLVPILQSASVVLSPDRKDREQHPRAVKEIHIEPVYSRLLTTVLFIVAILGFALLWQLQRRRSGLVADVKGIAGIAAMANRSHILMDFKNMDTATLEKIHQTLKAHRYSLRNSSLAPEEKVPLTQADKDKYDQQKRTDNPHPFMLRLIAGIPFIIGMALFLMIVPIVLFTKANSLTDKAPWLMTVFAVSIKLAWGTLETDVRMIEPFYILSKRHASPRVLALDYTGMAFGWMPINAFLNKHILVGLVGLGSVFAEVLTVCVTSFSTVTGSDFTSDNGAGTAGEETFNSFWVSFSFSISILTYLCAVATLVYCRRRHPFLPRQPNSIASVLAFIHQSKMLYDFVGTEKMSDAEMVSRLVGIGKTYGLGWFTGRDGERHCGVDEEELLGNYERGRNARDAVMPWTANWENY